MIQYETGTDNNFDWIPFYMEFADKLLKYMDDRSALLVMLQEAHAQAGIRFPTIDLDGRIIDVDPFTVFGFFNKGLKDENRLKLAQAFKQRFEIASPVPTGLAGIPVVDNRSATFYYFVDSRRDEDIDNLWAMFQVALQYADDADEQSKELFVKAYDKLMAQHGIKWNLTMGLYWIRPLFYLSLDSRNRWFLEEQEALGNECASIIKGIGNVPPDGIRYLELRDIILKELERSKYTGDYLPALSYEAWGVSERINEENREREAREKGKVTIGDDKVDVVRYWLIAPGSDASEWDDFYAKGIVGLGWGEVGDINSYDSKEAIAAALMEKRGGTSSYKNSAHALWQFAHEMKPGDIIFAKKGVSQLVGRGVVLSDYRFDASRPDTFKNIRQVEWTHRGEWPHPGQAAMKTLTDITQYTDYVEKLNALFADANQIEDEVLVTYPPYDKDDFLDEVYLEERDYDQLVSLLREKKNVILQGAPGVGKTFAAKRLAYSMMGEKNQDRVELIQFHQSYSYEDFIMGYRPNENGFELKRGAFYNFCRRAQDDLENEYFFIIDEINRGNLSKIFGELFMLVEADKRGVELRLLYSDERFSVPSNVYIIGMMNTADRSLAMLDYALRRRFAFFDLRPSFDSDGFVAYRDGLGSAKLNELLACVVRLNETIAADETLGDGFCIGHSYFCGMKSENVTDAKLSAIVEYELVPMLREYWFDEPGKVREWADALRRSIK